VKYTSVVIVGGGVRILTHKSKIFYFLFLYIFMKEKKRIKLNKNQLKILKNITKKI
jgi:hypothetical protein